MLKDWNLLKYNSPLVSQLWEKQDKTLPYALHHSKGYLPAPEQWVRLLFRKVRWNESARYHKHHPLSRAYLLYGKKDAWELSVFSYSTNETWAYLHLCVVLVFQSWNSLPWKTVLWLFPQSERRKFLPELIQTCVHGSTVPASFLALWNLNAKVMHAHTAKSSMHRNKMAYGSII